MDWLRLNTVSQIGTIAEASHNVPCLILKHSPTCSLSFISKSRLENDWPFPTDTVTPFILDVVADRSLARAVAERFSVHHESPQILLIWKGACVYDDSHLDISVADLAEFMAENAVAVPG
ncbi:MAG: bacillithiol system redox-active protein YtxJ [Saprospiraceae bacterium]